MLVQTDIRKLKNDYVLGEEAYEMLREDTDNQMQKYRLHDQEEMKNEARKSGLKLHSSEFIARIHRIAPHVQVRKGSFDDFLTLWVPNPGAEFQNDDKRGCQYIQAAFTQGWLPEHTFVRVDDNNQIKAAQAGGVQQGWRTILLRLLQFRVVTWKQVMGEFGDVTGLHAKRWHETTREYRF